MAGKEYNPPIPTIKKTTCELYELRGLPHHGWADITINAKDFHGRIQISSDWGNWAYFWSSCGEPFKKFLPGLKIDYTAGKFGESHWFDSEKTIEEFKKHTLEQRRQGGFQTPADARHVWDEIVSLEGETGETGFCMALEGRCDHLLRFYEHCPSLIYGISPMFKLFWRDCWLIFMNELKKENK